MNNQILSKLEMIGFPSELIALSSTDSDSSYGLQIGHEIYMELIDTSGMFVLARTFRGETKKVFGASNLDAVMDKITCYVDEFGY